MLKMEFDPNWIAAALTGYTTSKVKTSHNKCCFTVDIDGMVIDTCEVVIRYLENEFRVKGSGNHEHSLKFMFSVVSRELTTRSLKAAVEGVLRLDEGIDKIKSATGTNDPVQTLAKLHNLAVVNGVSVNDILIE
jgi:hypothetical protein